MSNNKKKNTKKKMKPETKQKIGLGFASLINNEACIKIGRNWKWYFPVITGILAIMIALVPSFTQNMQTKLGDNLMNAPSYGIENGLVHVGEFLQEKNIDLVVNEEEQIVDNGSWRNAFSTDNPYNNEKAEPWYTCISTNPNTDEEYVIIEAFFNDSAYYAEQAGGEPVSDIDFANNVLANKNPYNGVARGSEEDVYDNAAVIFGKEHIYIIKVGSDGSVGQAVGRYDRLIGVNFKNYATSDFDGVAYTATPETYDYTNAVRETWRRVINAAAESDKNIQALSYLGIMAAVYIGLAFVFGLVIFLMTRGKKNPLRIYTFWETQKMAYTAALCPAILSLILGFLITSFALFMFIFLYGIRIMWMSMRSLRAPTY